jgi:non-ribosomal peptide synthetase component F
MVLLAAFAILLHKQSGSRDFCVGSPFTHRKLVETEPIIGLFVNMLVFRCKIDESKSFRALLRDVRNYALEAYENSDVPFQKLVRILNVDTRSSRSPIFQIMFGFDADTVADPGPSGALQMNAHHGLARYDLTLQLGESSDGISGMFEYCTDLFDKNSIIQLREQLLNILNEVTLQPGHPIHSIKISSDVAPTQIFSPDQPVRNKPKGLMGGLVQWLSRRAGRAG